MNGENNDSCTLQKEDKRRHNNNNDSATNPQTMPETAPVKRQQDED